jgi:AmiR/NasT family two-component response regulator
MKRRATSVVVGSGDLFGMLGLQRELEQMGIRVAGCAADAAQAVRAARLLAPGAVILDLGPNRQETFAAAREITERRFAPVLFLMPNMDSALVKAGVAAGAAGFLTHPLQEADAFTKIEIAASRFAAQRELETQIGRLERQMATREAIGAAKFHLMERYGWREAEAHRYMQTLSMNSRKPMAAVADRILFDECAGAALNVARCANVVCTAA